MSCMLDTISDLVGKVAFYNKLLKKDKGADRSDKKTRKKA